MSYTVFYMYHISCFWILIKKKNISCFWIICDDKVYDHAICISFQTEVLAAIFSLPHGEFLSSWCSSDLPVREEDASLEYDPFVAAGWVLDSFSSPDLLNLMSSESTFIQNNMSQAPYAHQRTSLLVKVIANLHCFVPNICEGWFFVLDLLDFAWKFLCVWYQCFLTLL